MKINTYNKISWVVLFISCVITYFIMTGGLMDWYFEGLGL